MDTSKAEDETRFNETLKRMLKTPPQLHDDSKGSRTKPPRKDENRKLA